MFPRSFNLRYFVVPGVVLCIAALTSLAPPGHLLTSQVAAPEETIQEAWRLAQRVGVYGFTSEVSQQTYPAPSLANAGRGSHVETMYLSGQVNLPQQQLSMIIKQGTGNPSGPNAEMEIHVEGDQAYGRLAGEDWQAIDNMADLFAPGNDLLAYLAGARNVTAGEAETRAGITFTPYRFELDGSALASYMRQQLERELRRAGKLPAGISLADADQAQATTGAGELWIDVRGLPLRLQLDIAYPPTSSGERVEAAVKSDFSGFDPEAVAAASPSFASDLLGRLTGELNLAVAWRQFGRQILFIAVALADVGLMLAHSHSPTAV